MIARKSYVGINSPNANELLKLKYPNTYLLLLDIHEKFIVPVLSKRVYFIKLELSLN